MKFDQIAAIGVAAMSMAGVAASQNKSGYVYERLDKEKAAVLVVDHQVGLFQLTRDMEPTMYHNNLLAHAALAELFDIPIVLTTSAENGPNGPLPKEIIEMYPNAPYVARNGEVNAWDNEAFREAVRATNRTQFIISGIVTDVCTAFLAQSLREEGYGVWANIEASGTVSTLLRETANDIMKDAGVHVLGLFAIVCELMRHWGHTPGAAEVKPYLNRYMPSAGYMFRSHAAAVTNGTLAPGQEGLIIID